MSDSAAASANRPRLRFRWRYSLRSLVIFLTLACIGTWYWFRVPFEQSANRPMTELEISIVGTGLPVTDPFADPFGPPPSPPLVQERQQFRRVLFGEPLRHGKTTSYYALGKQVLGEEHWQDGRLHGPWIRRHRNGAIAQRGGYHGGKKTGRWEIFDSQGSLFGRMTFEGSVPHGDAVWILPDKTLRAIRYAYGEAVELDGLSNDDPLGEARRTGDITNPAVVEALDLWAVADFVDLPLRDVTEFYSELFRSNLQLDKRSLAEHAIPVDAPMSFGPSPPMPAGAALIMILEPYDLVMVYRFEQIWITHQNDARRWVDRTGVAKLVASPPADVPPARLEKVKDIFSKSAIMDFVDVPVTEALHQLADDYGVEIACCEPLLQQVLVNTQAHNVSLESALSTMCEELSAHIGWGSDHSLVMQLWTSRP